MESYLYGMAPIICLLKSTDFPGITEKDRNCFSPAVTAGAIPVFLFLYSSAFFCHKPAKNFLFAAPACKIAGGIAVYFENNILPPPERSFKLYSIFPEAGPAACIF